MQLTNITNHCIKPSVFLPSDGVSELITIIKPQTDNLQTYKAKLRVLVVDDEIDFNDAFCSRINKLGIYVNACYSGKDALKKIAENDYDLIFLDIKLNDISGVEVYKNVIKKKPNLSIAFISAYMNEEEGKSAKELTSVFFEKPINFAMVEDFLSNLKNK